MQFQAEQSVNLNRNRGNAVFPSPAYLNSISSTSNANRKREFRVVHRVSVVEYGKASKREAPVSSLARAESVFGSVAHFEAIVSVT